MNTEHTNTKSPQHNSVVWKAFIKRKPEGKNPLERPCILLRRILCKEGIDWINLAQVMVQ